MRQRAALLRWLRVGGLAFAIAAPAAFAAVGVNKTFNPINVSAGQVSTLTVFLLNNNPSAATGTAFTDTLPGTVVVANPANATTSCGGAVTAAPGAASFSLSGGTIPAASGGVAGQCTVTVDVVSPAAGVFINNIPAGAVASSQGTNPQNANATLTVAALQSVTGAKAFAPTNLHGGGTASTVTLTLTNANGVALTSAALTDNLPASLAIATPPNASTTCGAGTVTTGVASAALTNGTIPANGSCTIRFDVIAANPNAFVDANVANAIAANALTTAQGVGNSAFAANVRLQTGARVEKVFAPTPITTGGTSTLTVTVRNFNATPLSGIAFTDTFPVPMQVAGPVTTGTTCAGLTFTPVPGVGNPFFTVSGGSLPAAPAGIANANCTVTINVTATNAGVNPVTLTNTIPVGTFGGVGFSSGSGALVVNAASSVGGSKSFSPGTILQGGVTTLTITLTNSAAAPAVIAAFTDALTTLGASPQFTVAAAPPATTTCGANLSAAPGATTIMLGPPDSIPAGGSCTITVPVQASATASTGTRTNTIAQGALQTNRGRTQAAITANLVVNPVLSVAKAVAPATVAAGADTRMTVTLTRAAGAVALNGLAFTDTLPAGHLVSATPNLVNNCGGAVTATSGTNVVSLAGGSLAGGAAATNCTILVNVTTPAGAGAAINTIAAGAVTSAQGFVNPAAASATITRVVTSVTLNKSFNPATVIVGGTSQLTINVLNTNTSAIALTTTGLVDTLPAGMVIATPPASSNTCGGALTAVAGAGTVTLSNGSIAANATCRIQLNVVANASGNLINPLAAGLFTSAQGVTNPLPASATLAATGVADLQITKTDGVASVTPGTSTTYTIVASNLGPNAVAGASVVDTPPAGVTFTGWTCVASAGSICGNPSGSGAINELATLLNGGSATYTVTAVVAPGASGSISNTATVTAPATVVDPNSANNTATDTDTLTPVADLAITKTDGVVTVTPGSGVTYTIVASNAGPSTAVGATVADVFPAAFLGATWTCVGAGGGTCPASGSGNIGVSVNLPPGGTATFTVVGTVSGAAIGTLVNTATVVAPAGVTDPNPGNNSATDTDTLTPIADLAITKTDGSATAVPGSPVIYTIIASNAGPSAVAGATVADTLPASLTGATWTCVGAGGGTCPASGSGNISASVNLPVGGIATFTLTATVSASATGTLANTATVVPPAGVTDPNPANNSTTDSDTLTPTADLAITKTDGVANVTPGAGVTYTIVASNAGPSAVPGATVADTLPASLTGATWTCVGAGGGTCPASGSGNISASVNLPVGGTATFTVTATLSASATGTLANTATVAAPAGVTDPNPGNNSATDTDTITPTADLSITKTDGSASAVPGNPVTYTIVASNAGPSAVTGATVADTLPAVLTVATWTCVGAGGGTCPVSGSGNIGAAVNLPVGATATFTLTATLSASASGTLANTATITVPAGVTDPNPGNNAATDTDTLTPTADLSITKTDGSTTAVPGNPVTYTIVASNSGPSVVTGATVTDILPAILTGATWTCVGAGGGTCPASGSGNISATVNLPVGATASFTLTATLSPSATGTLVNTVTVAAPAGVTDPNPGNNSATDIDTITPTADLSITKTDGSATAVPGNPVTYTIVASNAGPSAVTGATVADTLPAVLTGATWTCVGAGGGTCPASGSGNIGAAVNLPVGATATFTLTVTLSASATGTVSNTATTAAPAGVTDPNPGNNTATDTDTITPTGDLSITKTDGSATAVPGNPVTYTIVASNAGPSAVTGATVTDTLPAVLTGATWTCVGAGGGTCPASGSGNIGAAVNLPVGATATFTLTATLSAAATGTLLNTATVTVPAGVTDPNPGNNSATDSDALNAQVSLGVVKSDGSATYTPGGTATYTVTVTNGGPSAGSNVTVADALPAGVTLSANVTCVASGTAACGTVTGTTGQTNFGATGASIGAAAADNLVFTVPVAFASGMTTDPLVNTANATDLAASGPGSTASGSDSDTRSAAVTLAVTKTDGATTYTPGGTATYSVTVANTGTTDALDVTVADALPAGVTLAANATCVANGTSSCGTVTGTTGQTSFGATSARVDAGGANTIVLTVPVAFAPGMATDPLVNTAVATDVPTGTTANGSDSDTLSSNVTLALTKTDGSATYTPGGTATYTVTLANTGLSDALNVTVADALPAGVALAANATCAANGTSSCGTVTGTTGQTSFGATAARVDTGAANTLVFTVPVAFAAGMTTDPLVNTATATDATSGNAASGSDSDTLSPSVTLGVVKTDGSATYTPGGAATYTVTITNTGLSDALNVTVADALPAGVALAANVTCAAGGTSSCGTVTGTTGQTSFGATAARVNAGAGNALVFTAPVAFAAGMTTDPLINTATATDAPSGITANGSDSDTLAASVTLAVVKTDGSATYTPGGTATYTVTVANTGLSDALNVTVADALPAGVTLSANATCVAGGTSICGTVTGTTGQTSFGATAARVDAGGANAIVFTVPVAFSAGMSTDPLVNTATATDAASSATANGSDSDALAANVTLAVAKTDGSATYTPGGTATYTVTVTNTGVSDALNLTLADPLPAGVTLTANATCVAGGTSVCGAVTGIAGQTSFGATGARVDIGAGNTLVFTAPVAFAPGMSANPLVNTATANDLTSGASASGADSDTLLSAIGLAVTKTDGSATYTPGGTATYTIVVTNGGPGNAANVTVADALPAGVTLSANAVCVPSGSATCGTVTGTTGATSFGTTGATIAAGPGNQLTFTVPVAFAGGLTTDPLVNTVTVTDPSAPSPVSASDSDARAAAADLVIVKTGPATLTAGSGITYTLAISNGGPSAANGTTFNDNVPGIVTGIAASCGSAAGGAACGAVTVVGNNVSGVLAALPVGGSVVITITGTISGTASGAVTNVAIVSPPGGVADPTPGNASSSATTNFSASAATQIPVNAPWALAALLLAIAVLGARRAATVNASRRG